MPAKSDKIRPLLEKFTPPITKEMDMYSIKLSKIFKARIVHGRGMTHPLALRIFFKLIVVLAALASLAAPSWVMAQKTTLIAPPNFDAVDEFVQAEMEAVGIPGLELVIVHEDQIVHSRGFGIADPSGRAVTQQTPFNIGSVTKTFTALAIMQLVEAGKIELDAPVQRYLPWFRVADPDASARIRVLDLLNHTSGIPESAGNDYPEKNDTSDTALEQRVRSLDNVQLNHPVGSRWEYSNANYDTLGLIVQVVSAQPYETYLQENIFTPLEMSNTFSSQNDALQHGLATGYRMWFGIPLPYAEPAPRPHRPSGSQFSTAEDLAHLLIAHLNDGNYKNNSVLSKEGVHTMQNSPVSTGFGCGTYSMHWGHGSSCDSSTLGLSGDAANFKARILLSPDDKWAVVLLMNTQVFSINGPRQERIKDGVFSLLLGEAPVTNPSHNMQIISGIGLIAIVTMLLIAGMVRSFLRLQRRKKHPQESLHVMRHVVIPLAFEALWIIILIGIVNFAAGSRSSEPLSFMLENIPELGWLIVLSAAIALGWGILRTLWSYLALRAR
jgi:CubicO group peptidase (beta-lactamase class C family)